MCIGGPRVVRAVAAATGTTCAALWMHLLGGGPMPGPGPVVLVWSLTAVVCLALVGRRLPRARLFLGVAAGQVLFHHVFVSAGRFGPVGQGDAHAGHIAHAGHAVAGGSAPSPWRAALEAWHMSPRMLAAHLVATLVTVALLRFCERALVTLRLALIRLWSSVAPSLALLVLLASGAVLMPRRAWVPAPAPSPPRCRDAGPGIVRRRGPPSPMPSSLTLAA